MKQYKPRQCLPLILLIFLMLAILTGSQLFTFWLFSLFFPQVSSGIYFWICIGVWMIISILLGYLVIIKLGNKITGIEETELKNLFYGLLIIFFLLVSFGLFIGSI